MATRRKTPRTTNGDAAAPRGSARKPVRGGATRGAGGERHDQADGKHPPLTTNQGMPIADNQNTLRAFMRGPALLEDFVLREKITHFDHERIPEPGPANWSHSQR